MDAYLAMARRGRAYVFGDGGFRINPIHGADLAVACADAVEGGPADVPIGGPDVLTHEAIARDAFAAV